MACRRVDAYLNRDEVSRRILDDCGYGEETVAIEQRLEHLGYKWLWTGSQDVTDEFPIFVV
jgi:hypothetical protein